MRNLSKSEAGDSGFGFQIYWIELNYLLQLEV